MLQQIFTVEEMKEWLEKANEGDVIFFKHSFRCPISAGAKEEVEAFIASNPHITIIWVDVVENRDASNHLAEASGVIHQSPQIIFYQSGQPVWNTSHRDITTETLTENIL